LIKICWESTTPSKIEKVNLPRKPNWIETEIKNGIMEVKLISWRYFHDYVRKEMLDYSHFIWRGQREAKWKLESSLDRLLRGKPESRRHSYAHLHLEKFKLAARGRRGPNPSKIESENDWWALGQHQGLATPLLDWTESPFVALYFAFEDEEAPESEARAVWSLGAFQKKNREIITAHSGTGPPPTLESIRPAQDENSRLVNQAGLFTRVPLGKTIDSWVEENHAGVSDEAGLLKIIIPNMERPECLRTLNKMNINHLSLFPDLYGAGQHCNKSLRIDKY
jgi:FRG domain